MSQQHPLLEKIKFKRFKGLCTVTAEEIFQAIEPELLHKVDFLIIEQSEPTENFNVFFEAAGDMYVKDCELLTHRLKGLSIEDDLVTINERVCNWLKDLPSYSSSKHYMTSLQKLDGYLVCSVLLVDIQSKYYLITRGLKSYCQDTVLSVVTMTIIKVLAAFDKALAEIIDTDNSIGINNPDRDSLLREIAKEFANLIGRMVWASDLYETLNIISSLPYEGAEGEGRILLTSYTRAFDESGRSHPNMKEIVKLKEAVGLTNYKGVRKLLELSQGEYSLLVSDGYGSGIDGLGIITGKYNEKSESLFEIKFVKQYVWEIRHSDQILIRVAYGKPVTISSGYNLELVRKNIEKEFTEITTQQTDNLLELVEEACKQPHGTLVIISNEAEAEAIRLAQQSTLIEPLLMNTEILKLVSSIDGAILLNPKGVCYAIGVILDGLAYEGIGDSSRGSRYNSALRYVNTRKEKKENCLAIIVSEDGPVNVYPDYLKSDTNDWG